MPDLVGHDTSGLIGGEEIGIDGFQGGVLLVFFGEDGVWGWPIDVDLGVGEVYAKVVAGGVDVGAFVGDVGGIGEDAEAVGEAFGNIHLLMVFVGEHSGGPAAEGIGAASDVHGDVEDFALDDVNEFGLRVF